MQNIEKAHKKMLLLHYYKSYLLFCLKKIFKPTKKIKILKKLLKRKKYFDVSKTTKFLFIFKMQKKKKLYFDL